MEEQELILSLIEGTSDIIHSVSPDGRFEFVNRAWIEKLGYGDGEWETINLRDIIFPGQLKNHSEVLGQILAGKKIAHVEVTFVTKDGSIIYAEGNMFPRTIDGKVVAANYGDCFWNQFQIYATGGKSFPGRYEADEKNVAY